MQPLATCWAVFGLAACGLATAPAYALSMEEALAETARTNPTLSAARDAARMSHEGVAVARSAWLPTIHATAGGSVSRRENNVATNDIDQRSLELSYTQNLFRNGRDRARLRQATTEVLRHHALVEVREQDVFLEAAIAYLDVVRAARVVELRAASFAAIAARVRETEAQFRVGDRTRTDVAQAEAEHEIARVEVLSGRTEVEVARSHFRTVVGVAPEDLVAATEPSGLPFSLEEALEAVRRDEPGVRAAGAAVEASGYAVRAARAELGPRVDLQANMTRMLDHVGGLGGYDSSELSTAIGLRLTVPLYQAGAGGARLRRAIHERARLQDEHVFAIRNAELAAEYAWRRLEAARHRYTAYSAAVGASREALAGILREAEVGERTVREVLDAESSLVSNRVRALSAERDAVVEAYRLMAAVGKLTARKLEISGLPDLVREAAAARRNLAPGILSFVGALND